MGETQLITMIAGVVISVISYFLKNTMDKLSKVEALANENQSKLNLLKNDHGHLDNKFNTINSSLRELTLEIKSLTREVVNIQKFIQGIFTDESGNVSSKRFVAVIGGLALIVFMFMYQTPLSVESVLILTTSLFGVTAAVSIFGNKDKDKDNKDK